MRRSLTWILPTVLLLAGCGGEAASPSAARTTPRRGPVGFVNRVWRVERSSSGTSGTLYVFLSEGTLVMASPHGKPAFGTWKYEGQELSMVEEGIPYRVDILKLGEDEFTIRSHNPGGFVDIVLVPATSENQTK